MSPHESAILTLAAASVGFFHTLLGPDHYVPFIAFSKAGKWSAAKTAVVTLLCGIGHVLSSVMLASLGILLGIGMRQIEALETSRARLATGLMIAFGLVYFVWGLRQAMRNRPHEHWHGHADGIFHRHEHVHEATHIHTHEGEHSNNMTPWVLFVIFIFGPCEPLIPLVMYPAARGHLWAAGWVTVVFGAMTLMTMLGMVLASCRGLNLLPLERMERYMPALAGATISLCGLAMYFSS